MELLLLERSDAPVEVDKTDSRDGFTPSEPPLWLCRVLDVRFMDLPYPEPLFSIRGVRLSLPPRSKYCPPSEPLVLGLELVADATSRIRARLGKNLEELSLAWY